MICMLACFKFSFLAIQIDLSALQVHKFPLLGQFLKDIKFLFHSIPTAVSGDTAIYATEMYQKESSGAAQRLIFSKFDAAELDSLIKPGAILDAFISLDTYDYQQSAGIRLVAKRLIIHS